MDEKRVTGEVKKVAGQAEGAAGDLTGDKETKADGQATELRGTGTGWAAGFGRIASILAPLSVPWLLEAGGGNQLLFGVFAGFFGLAAAATWAVPERRGERLTDVLRTADDRESTT